MSINPILSSRELLDKYHSGISVYAIPDTHRIVSVEMLKEIEFLASWSDQHMLKECIAGMIEEGS